jgi:hypothetical protein
LNKVDLPEPEGPEITKGLADCLAYIINIIGFSRLLYIYLVNKKLNVRIEKILNSV